LYKSIILLGFIILIGCSISPFDGSGEPNGSIYVAATDTGANELIGAIVQLDGVERPERTPAYLHGISVGEHEIVVKQYGYWNDTLSTSVVGGDTSSASFTLSDVAADQTGLLNFDTQPSGGQLLIDGHAYLVDGQNVIAPATVPLTWGTYNVSAYLDGHATIDPILPKITITAGESNSVVFQLEQTETALLNGKLPFMFKLENDIGDSVSLSDLRGYAILLNFWYVNCVPCQREFPGIDSVYQRHAINGFQVLGIDAGDDDDQVRTFRSDFNLTFQLLLDPDRAVNTQYGVRAYPRNILIDRTGIIHEILGPVTQDELEEKLEEIL
jgi:peroxiredoxin